MLKFHDRVKVISKSYCCAHFEELGTIVDNEYQTRNGDVRYLVRWDSTPTVLFGAHSTDIEKVKEPSVDTQLRTPGTLLEIVSGWIKGENYEVI